MKSLLLLTITVIITGCTSSKRYISTNNNIPSITDTIFAEVVEIRRNLHQNPEIASKEIETQRLLIDYLTKLGLEVETGRYGKSVIGILKGGKKGKKIAWRADMDALPMDLNENIPFRSAHDGISHGCGHDVHMAIALGIAKVLSQDKNALSGTLYFIFQPEEETFLGAKGMLENNMISDINPDEIYGLHVTALPVGEIMVRPNEVFAYQKRINIKLNRNSERDRIDLFTKNLVKKLTRTVDMGNPADISKISDVAIGLANRNTIFRDYRIIDDHFSVFEKQKELNLEAYIYETDAEKLPFIIPTVKDVLQESGLKDELISISFVQENLTIQNNKALTMVAFEILNKINGDHKIKMSYGQVPYFNDDFAYFQKHIPGVYFLLGGSNFEKGLIAMNHDPNFQVDEECMRVGISNFSSLLFHRLIFE